MIKGVAIPKTISKSTRFYTFYTAKNYTPYVVLPDFKKKSMRYAVVTG